MDPAIRMSVPKVDAVLTMSAVARAMWVLGWSGWRWGSLIFSLIFRRCRVENPVHYGSVSFCLRCPFSPFNFLPSLFAGFFAILLVELWRRDAFEEVQLYHSRRWFGFEVFKSPLIEKGNRRDGMSLRSEVEFCLPHYHMVLVRRGLFSLLLLLHFFLGHFTSLKGGFFPLTSITILSYFRSYVSFMASIT